MSGYAMKATRAPSAQAIHHRPSTLRARSVLRAPTHSRTSVCGALTQRSEITQPADISGLAPTQPPSNIPSMQVVTKFTETSAASTYQRSPGQQRLIQHKKEAYWFYRYLSIVYDYIVNPGHWTTDMREDALSVAQLNSKDLKVCCAQLTSTRGAALQPASRTTSGHVDLCTAPYATSSICLLFCTLLPCSTRT